MIEALIAKYEFPVSETLVQQQVDARMDRGLRALAHKECVRKTCASLICAAAEGQHDSALNEVKARSILDNIAEDEKIESSG